MANLVSVERADLSFGTVHVLDSVSLGVGEGDAIGVVGRNGGGKSTLLRVLGGRQDLDGGRAVQTGDLTVGYLPQGDHLAGDATVRSVVVGGAPEHEWAADARVRDVLRGLLGGIDAAGVGGLDARCGVLSGGEGRRVALAGLLVADPDLLLLDEPTNHLDVEGVAWLAGYLARRRDGGAKALVTVTHDRWFLDAVATLTWEVVDGAVEGYEGGYAAYVLAKAERERIGTATEQRRGNLLRKELAWLRRGPPARTTKPRFRLDAAASLIEAEPPPRDEVELVSFATRSASSGSTGRARPRCCGRSWARSRSPPGVGKSVPRSSPHTCPSRSSSWVDSPTGGSWRPSATCVATSRSARAR